MPHRSFIHSTADVRATLDFAFDSGFKVIHDAPQPMPCPHFLRRSEISMFEKGIFFFIRSEWEFGEYQMCEVPAGYHEGKFILSPRVNFAPITIYFQGERVDRGKRHFGNGELSFHRDWLAVPNERLIDTPLDVEEWFKKFEKYLFSKTVIKAGVHHYRVCKRVLDDPKLFESFPPFDFISWPPEALKKTRNPRHPKAARP